MCVSVFTLFNFILCLFSKFLIQLNTCFSSFLCLFFCTFLVFSSKIYVCSLGLVNPFPPFVLLFDVCAVVFIRFPADFS